MAGKARSPEVRAAQLPKAMNKNVFKFVFLFAVLLRGGLLPALASTDDSSEFEKSALAAPLFSGNLNPALNPFNPLNGSSLLENLYNVSRFGDLEYQQVGDTSFRLRFQVLKEPAGFFWLLNKKLDLRNQWVRIIYSGTFVPEHAFLALNVKKLRADSLFLIYFQHSSMPETSYFKLPANLPEEEIHSLGLVFDADEPPADFMIVGLEVLPPGEDPLAIGE